MQALMNLSSRGILSCVMILLALLREGFDNPVGLLMFLLCAGLHASVVCRPYLDCGLHSLMVLLCKLLCCHCMQALIN